MSDQSSGWVRESIIPSKEILQNVLASGHDDFTASISKPVTLNLEL
jgi:hypothetical protein